MASNGHWWWVGLDGQIGVHHATPPISHPPIRSPCFFFFLGGCGLSFMGFNGLMLVGYGDGWVDFHGL